MEVDWKRYIASEAPLILLNATIRSTTTATSQPNIPTGSPHGTLYDNLTTTVTTTTTTVAPPGPPGPGGEGNEHNGAFWPLIAAMFTFSAILISLWEMCGHLIHFNKPYLQKYVMRILFMVPIYAVNSWLGLTWPRSAIYLDTCRECYEAFVIYSFMKYLFNFLYYEMDLDGVIDCKPRVKHLFPICWLPPCSGGRRFLHHCRHGVLQYVVTRPITTFFALFSQMVGIYGEGQYTLTKTWIYLLIINNISQMIAMYSLVIFYTAYRHELAPMRPLGKFLCIKSVVFFSFFQGVLISMFVEIGLITRSLVPIWTDKDEPAEMIARNLQDFLICIEMLLAAVAHLFAFSHAPFVDLAAVRDPCCFALFRTMDFTDERSDVIDHMRAVRGRMRDIVRPVGSWWHGRNKYTTAGTSSSCLYADEARLAANVITSQPYHPGYGSYEDYAEPLIPLLPTASSSGSWGGSGRRGSRTSGQGSGSGPGPGTSSGTSSGQGNRKSYNSTDKVRDIIIPD